MELQDLHDRVRRAVEESGMSTEQVGEALGVTRGYVSHWMTGRRTPSAEQLEQLAEALGVSPSWLRRGAPGESAAPILEAEWWFRRAPADGGRDYGNPNVFAMPVDPAKLKREVGQNTRDAAHRTSTQLHMRYRIIELPRGSEAYDRFMEAVEFDQLREHIRRASRTDSKLGARLRSGLARLEERDSLVLLRIDDYGTTGLFGAERSGGPVDRRDRNPFAALVKNNLDSSKLTSTAGGSFGLGKAVLWRCSDLSTVLFASEIAPDYEREARFRVSAKSELTWHQLGEEEPFAGPGWLSEPGTEAGSLWTDEPGVLRALQLDRTDLPPGVDRARAWGTSILILGFRDPSAPGDFDAEATAEALRREAAKNFWLLMEQGRLRVTVERADGGRVVASDEVNPRDYVPELCEAWQRHQQDEVVEELAEPGDVMRVSIPLGVTRTREDAPGVVHYQDDLESRCHLLIRAPDDPITAEDELDSVAMVRGAGMVVKYWPRQNIVVGGRRFHAVLLAGEAAGGDETQLAAEQMLRTSEPPAHDAWEYNDDLRDKYYPGPGTRIKEMEKAVTDAIREAIRPREEGDEEGPRELRRLLQLGTTPPSNPPPATIRSRSAQLLDGAWQVSAEIHMNDRQNKWRIRPRLWLDVEAGTAVRLPWESFSVGAGGAEEEGGALIIDPGTRRVAFSGISASHVEGIPAAECRLKLDLRIDRIQQEGE